VSDENLATAARSFHLTQHVFSHTVTSARKSQTAWEEHDSILLSTIDRCSGVPQPPAFFTPYSFPLASKLVLCPYVLRPNWQWGFGFLFSGVGILLGGIFSLALAGLH